VELAVTIDRDGERAEPALDLLAPIHLACRFEHGDRGFALLDHVNAAVTVERQRTGLVSPTKAFTQQPGD